MNRVTKTGSRDNYEIIVHDRADYRKGDRFPQANKGDHASRANSSQTAFLQAIREISRSAAIRFRQRSSFRLRLVFRGSFVQRHFRSRAGAAIAESVILSGGFQCCPNDRQIRPAGTAKLVVKTALPFRNLHKTYLLPQTVQKRYAFS